MLDTTRIVVVTPAGRKRYLEILFRYILKLRPIMDEYRLWVNTENNEDIEYMNENRRIMIVDDEPYNVLGLTIILQQSGYQNIQSIIDCAHTG